MGKNEYTYTNGYNGTLKERMENKTLKAGDDDCWLWTASCDTAGYPTIRVDGKLRRASHIAFELYSGHPVPNGSVLMHSCDTPRCVNPRHLSVGTKHLNNVDKMLKGRCNPSKGEHHHASKLTADDVKKIRSMFSSGGHTFISIAAMFHVKRTTIARAVRGKNWKCVKTHPKCER